MKQEQIAGILLCAIGLLLAVKLMLVWQITESWKTEGTAAPSAAYRKVLRVASGGAIGVEAMLALGILW